MARKTALSIPQTRPGIPGPLVGEAGIHIDVFEAVVGVVEEVNRHRQNDVIGVLFFKNQTRIGPHSRLERARVAINIRLGIIQFVFVIVVNVEEVRAEGLLVPHFDIEARIVRRANGVARKSRNGL